jgi:Ti-type conjugative transfer relaxase TraA
MILNGNQRGYAKELALHLMNEENEVVSLHELRGFLSPDLMGALNEAYAISRGTRCQQFLYSLSLNPPHEAEVSIEEFEATIERAEKQLGLDGQPRAIVFHEKNGRRHCHVVWSRIDIEKMKAIQMSHDREKLTSLSRELFLEYGWDMPRGLKERGARDPLNYDHAQYQQANRVGKDPAQIKADIQAAWNASDSRKALEHALSERGYYLAQGDRRGFVVVDEHGEIYSLPKQLPKGINTKQVRELVGDEKDLPKVADIIERLQKQPDKEPQHDPQKALAQVTRYHSAFTSAMMERSLKPKIQNEAARNSVIQEILKSPDLIHIGDKGGHKVYSTKAMQMLEQRMVEDAKTMANTSSRRHDDHAVQRAIYNLNNAIAKDTDGKGGLSDEQKQALKHMTSDKQLSLVVGVAGAGKTTIMQGTKEALEAQGYRVRGAAPSGVAASGLREIGMNASTLHSLEYRVALAQEMLDKNQGKALTAKQVAFVKSVVLTQNDVLIIDEAGMVSSKQLANIIDMTKQAGAKLVLVGDHEQLQSVEAGTAFRNLLERIKSVKLTEVRRQHTPWQRSATLDMSKGRIDKALSSYHKHGCIVQAKTRTDTKALLVKDVMKAQKSAPDKSRLVLAYTRKDVADLNAMMKAELVKTGKVAERDVDITVTVKEADIERQENQGFAIGDRVLFRKNDPDLGVMNGLFGTIKAAGKERFQVVLDNGKDVIFSPQDYNHIQLGYACTVHKSQGVTVDEAHVLATPHFDRHTSYVALSRHKQAVKLYASKKDFKSLTRLQRDLGKDGKKISTLEFNKSQEKHTAPAPVAENNLSIFRRISQFLGFGKEQDETENAPYEHNYSGGWIKEEKPDYKPEPTKDQENTRILDQKDFIKLREEFKQKAKTNDATQEPEFEAEPDQGFKLER